MRRRFAIGLSAFILSVLGATLAWGQPAANAPVDQFTILSPSGYDDAGVRRRAGELRSGQVRNSGATASFQITIPAHWQGYASDELQVQGN